MRKDMKTGSKGIELIKHFESLHDGDLSKIGLQPKMCPAGIWTVGYGRALYHDEKPIKGDDGMEIIKQHYPGLLTITEQEAEFMLAKDLERYEDIVNSKVHINLDQDQFDALVSHTYNTGGSETLFKLLNGLASMLRIMDWWTTKYITAGGVKLRGLERRRKSEWELFNHGNLDFRTDA